MDDFDFLFADHVAEEYGEWVEPKNFDFERSNAQKRPVTLVVAIKFGCFLDALKGTGL